MKLIDSIKNKQGRSLASKLLFHGIGASLYHNSVPMRRISKPDCLQTINRVWWYWFSVLPSIPTLPILNLNSSVKNRFNIFITRWRFEKKVHHLFWWRWRQFFYSSQNMLWWKSFRNVKSYWSNSWDWISLNFVPIPEFKAKIIFPNLPFVDKYFFLHFFGPSELGKSCVRAFSESSVPASALGLFIAICQSNFGPRALA